MNLLVQAAGIYTPAMLKRQKLLDLFACTADAFACEMPPVERLPYARLLETYARFTAAQAGQALAPQPHEAISFTEIRRRLYDGAYRMGADLRRTFRITSTDDALAAARVLYRALGIDLQASGAGEIRVRRCFFSDFYSSPVCGLIGSLDEGLFAGLSGGGRLTFIQRITEGCDCCLAEFRPAHCRG